jgi:alpha-L-rhamnosidase
MSKKPSHLRCEYLKHTLAVPSLCPRLSWVPPCDQTAWQVEVTQAGETVWDSGRVDSDQTFGIEYGGTPLEPLARYEWRVRVWDAAGQISDWSEPAFWGVGPEDAGWSWEPNGELVRQRGLNVAHWISMPLTDAWPENEPPPSPLLRREFTVTGQVARATLYVSALGLYEARLNGRRVGDQVLAPEWTDYHQKVQYQAYDVAALLRNGDNALGAILAPGWYAGRLGMAEWFAPTSISRGIYGRRLALIARLELEMIDGTRQTVTSNGDWRGTLDGPIRGADLLDGETYDARREIPGWDEPGFDDAGWQAAHAPKGPRLVPQSNEPIRITRELPGLEVTEPAPGVYVVDFGQNLVGWCRLRVSGQEEGQEIVLRHAEVLNPDGSVYLDNMRGARPVDRYICRGGDDDETFEPRFTYHGFRYVEITGLNGRPDLSDLTACVLHSAAPETGEFTCSDDMVNRIMQAIQWTQRGNLHSSPTDCPQRDERLGWMGDAQVFSQTAIFNMDMAAFFSKWTADIRDAQADDGRFPDIAPHPYNPNQCLSGNPGWADAGVIVPWNQYINYGDVRILEDQFDAARRYIDWSERSNPDLVWRNHAQLSPLWYGDWLNADTFANLPNIPEQGGEVPKEIYSTAFFARSCQLVANMADVLGRADESKHYGALAGRIRAAFNHAFVDTDGRIQGDTQAGYALALNFDLLPEALRASAAKHMVAALEPYGGAPSTGIQSTVRLMLELSRWGYHEEACAILLRREMPSWGYMVENGGTTIWERWDGWVEGRGFQNPGMNSFNHYAIGAVGEWVYRTLGGLNPDENAPGWKHFFIRPRPGVGLTSARTRYHSIRGLIRSDWNIADSGEFRLNVTIPPNTTATVELPDGTVHRSVGPGTHEW